MANEAFCRAVNSIATSLFPAGFDVSDSPPNTLRDLALHVARTGRMVVTRGPKTGNEFDTDQTWQAFRAWHDWCHVHGGHEFNLKGECSTVRMQHGMVAARYGTHRMREWMPILHKQIIHDNFGMAAVCPVTLN